METTNNFTAAFEAGQMQAEPRWLKGECPYVVVPNNARVEDLERMLPHPHRRKGIVRCAEMASFVRYVTNFRTPDTVLFANLTETSAAFTAIFDYHGTGPEGKAGWVGDRALFECVSTVEWTRWRAANGKSENQTKFAEFIEENMLDIIEPSGAQLFEMTKTLQAKTSVAFGSAVRLDNGNVQCLYEETTQTKVGQKGELILPEKFTIGLAFFKGGPKYKLEARLRYRIEEKKLSFRYDLVNPHLAWQAASLELLAAIEKGCGVPTYQGSI